MCATVNVNSGRIASMERIKEVKERIAVNGFPSHSYGTSPAIWDRTVLPATRQATQTCQVSRISRETPAFWGHLPLTRRVTKISRIASLALNLVS